MRGARTPLPVPVLAGPRSEEAADPLSAGRDDPDRLPHDRVLATRVGGRVPYRR